MTTSQGEQKGLSIGTVSTVTGIPTNTLRTWEKRYDFPKPMRSPGKHRIYDPRVVEHLLLIKRALELGHRTSSVVALPSDQLIALLEQSISSDPDELADEPVTKEEDCDEVTSTISNWLDAIKHYDAHRLDQSLKRVWFQQGAIRCLDTYLGPFVTRVGEAWASGEIKVAHEHFASERLRDFLTLQWRPMSDRARGPLIICTTLPDEQHNLGLQMVATTMALCGCKVLFLGPNTPIDDILHTAYQTKDPKALMISCAAGAPSTQLHQHLRKLNAERPQGCALIIGGQGAPVDDQNIPTNEHTTFNGLARWASVLARQAI